MFDFDGVFTQEYPESPGYSPVEPEVLEPENVEFDPDNPRKLVLDVYGEGSIEQMASGLLKGNIDALKASAKLLRCKNSCYVIIRGMDIGTIRADRRRKPVVGMLVDACEVAGVNSGEIMKTLG
jgi:hypothetical protein